MVRKIEGLPVDIMVGETLSEYRLRKLSEPAVAAEPKGMKFDGGKPRFSLLRFGCARALRGVANVLTFGAKKYAAHSWKAVDEGIDRYWSAMERHLNEIGIHGFDSRDEESGLLHIDHVNCNGMFLSELIRKQHGIED